MQIEAGKSYKAANGERIGPMEFWADNTDRLRQEPWDNKYWMLDGTGKGDARGNDLVAEWTDGPVRTETVTKRRIVPGVYGRIRVSEVVAHDPARKVIGLDWVDRFGNEAEGGAAMSADELDDLAMVASQLAEALRDGLD